MDNKKPSGPVADEVGRTLEQLGYSLVEFAAEVVKGRMHVHCVVHHPDGISLDQLTTVHRALEPRLEMLLDTRDLYIEFSSPGVERKVKSFHEFAIFTDRPVVIRSGDESIEGTISKAVDSVVEITTSDGEIRAYGPDAVRSARLLD